MSPPSVPQMASALGIAAQAKQPMTVCVMDYARAAACSNPKQRTQTPMLWSKAVLQPEMHGHQEYTASDSATFADPSVDWASYHSSLTLTPTLALTLTPTLTLTPQAFPNLTASYHSSLCPPKVMAKATHNCEMCHGGEVQCDAKDTGTAGLEGLTDGNGCGFAKVYDGGMVQKILGSEDDFRFGHCTYLQSPLYFWAIRDTIRQQLSFSPQLVAAGRLILEKHVGETSSKTTLVGVHFRAGDMAGKGCSAQYYINAMAYFHNQHKQRGSAVKFVVVAESSKAAAELLKTSSEAATELLVILPSGNRSAILDMCVLSQCTDVITSIGTFSWWSGFMSGGNVAYCSKLYRGADFWPKSWTGISPAAPTQPPQTTAGTGISPAAPTQPPQTTAGTGTRLRREVDDRANECLQFGGYVSNTKRGKPYTPDDSWQGICDETNRENRPWSAWDWQPTTTQCRKTADDIRAADVCDAFSNASVLIVGDSLSFLMYSSLVMRAGCSHAASIEHWHHKSMRDGKPVVAFLCGGSTTLRFVRNDRLLDPLPKKDLGICGPFWNAFDESDIVLFNRGAHHVDDDVLERELVNFAHALRRRARPGKQLVYYRTTAVGHPNCQNYSSPGPVPDLSSHHGYKWPSFQRQNELAERAIEGAAPGIVSFIDVFNTTLPRRDRHIGQNGDCLHYCLPGPPDWWVSIFAHRVLQHKRALGSGAGGWHALPRSEHCVPGGPFSPRQCGTCTGKSSFQ
jgi:hypothetical protein